MKSKGKWKMNVNRGHLSVASLVFMMRIIEMINDY